MLTELRKDFVKTKETATSPPELPSSTSSWMKTILLDLRDPVSQMHWGGIKRYLEMADLDYN